VNDWQIHGALRNGAYCVDLGKRELVSRWLLIASHDLAAARLLARGEQAIPDVAVYHCQQAAEKALKGFLVFWNESAGDTHDVGLLLEQAAKIEPCFDSWQDAAERLAPFAAFGEDPDAFEEPDLEQVEEALDDAECIYNQVLSYLPAEVHPETRQPSAG
jgi:HEPN domain-containing protein